ncbi:MAG: hypothetical protein JW829_14420 [Pirellulales bacterium]|nr:hypothetical protein [Pirellulales bacterium]
MHTGLVTIRHCATWMCCLFLAAGSPNRAAEPACESSDSSLASLRIPSAPVVKAVLKLDDTAGNLLDADRWQSWQHGYEQQGDVFLCDNGADTTAQRGVGQNVRLDQTAPEPIVAVASSRAENVTGSADSNYSLYLDLEFQDGDHLWGQAAPFATGTHGWQRRQVVVLPEKPVKSLGFYLLLRGHGGKAWFRDPTLHLAKTPAGACLFDGVPVAMMRPAIDGFQVRDVAAGSDFVQMDRQALGLKLDWQTETKNDATHFDVTLQETTGADRAITLLYTVAVPPGGLQWLHDPRHNMAVQPRREYLNAGNFRVAANGRLSRYPLAAVANRQEGIALGIDMMHPAFFRTGYHAETGELFLAWDIGLAPEKPSARLCFCRYGFAAADGFRGALQRYYEIYPESFRRRIRGGENGLGLWMPFARISQIEGWEDFGFRFKEGDNETGWDDKHDIMTFRYTEPMTWWMRMPASMPRTIDAALGEAHRLAKEGNPQAMAFLTSSYHDESGRPIARLLDTPWCNGAVWSINSMPGIRGNVTDFGIKWNPELREKLYGADAPARLDGEYIDSSEGYVTDELDYRREHFAAADTPLTFSHESYRPAIFRGLVAFEYARAIAEDVHRFGHSMMANGTPTRLCWLAPMLDVMGTETDWNPGGRWQPMSDTELLYRRALCHGKPYCFLMNTRFEGFSYELVEKYMQRCLAYGMFPGFFSHNASEGHYFTRPELYNRDRPLFKRYVPLCCLVAGAGWQPCTQAASDDEHVYIERFGNDLLTVFNDSPQQRTVHITTEQIYHQPAMELISGLELAWENNQLEMTLAGEAVAVIRLPPPVP